MMKKDIEWMKEWIERNTSPVDDEGRLYIWKRDLENLIVPKHGSSETSAPLIVSEELGVLLEDMELGKSSHYFTMIDALFHFWDNTTDIPTSNFISENKKELIEIILGNRGYEVEEVPIYHALIKGHELVHDYDVYWNCDKFNRDVFVSRLHPPLDNFTTELSKEEWGKLGIDDSNAEFIRVDGQL